MVAFAVPRHEQDLVLRVPVCVKVENVYVMLETLPLRLLAVSVKLLIGGICSVDEAEIHRGVIESLGVRSRVVLQEESTDGRVVYS